MTDYGIYQAWVHFCSVNQNLRCQPFQPTPTILELEPEFESRAIRKKESK